MEKRLLFMGLSLVLLVSLGLTASWVMGGCTGKLPAASNFNYSTPTPTSTP